MFITTFKIHSGTKIQWVHVYVHVYNWFIIKLWYKETMIGCVVNTHFFIFCVFGTLKKNLRMCMNSHIGPGGRGFEMEVDSPDQI